MHWTPFLSNWTLEGVDDHIKLGHQENLPIQNGRNVTWCSRILFESAARWSYATWRARRCKTASETNASSCHDPRHSKRRKNSKSTAYNGPEGNAIRVNASMIAAARRIIVHVLPSTHKSQYRAEPPSCLPSRFVYSSTLSQRHCISEYYTVCENVRLSVLQFLTVWHYTKYILHLAESWYSRISFTREKCESFVHGNHDFGMEYLTRREIFKLWELSRP